MWLIILLMNHMLISCVSLLICSRHSVLLLLLFVLEVLYIMLKKSGWKSLLLIIQLLQAVFAALQIAVFHVNNINMPLCQMIWYWTLATITFHKALNCRYILNYINFWAINERSYCNLGSWNWIFWVPAPVKLLPHILLLDAYVCVIKDILTTECYES